MNAKLTRKVNETPFGRHLLCTISIAFIPWWMSEKRNLFLKYPPLSVSLQKLHEPWHDKTNKVSVCPAKTQISLGIRPVWSESSLSAWRKLGSIATHEAHSEDSDQTGRMPRLIWVFAGCTVILLVLSWFASATNKVSSLSTTSL